MNAHNEPGGGWEEIRTAYHVARLGTLSAAAAHLGVHHATVIRRIDALEARLGCKLFQRHPRGYTPTEAGGDLLAVAASAEDQFAQLASRLKGQMTLVSGELTITALSVLSPWLAPILAAFQREHPAVRLNLILDERLLRLEHGEAHVALRAGPKPQEPDNIVRRIGRYAISMFAHRDYVKQYGMLDGLADMARHRFVVGIGPAGRAPMYAWLAQNLPDTAAVYRSTDMRSLDDAVMAGAGIGFMPISRGQADPDLVQMCPPMPEWGTDLWMVSHVDIARSAKVRAITAYLIEALAANLDQPG